VDEEVAEIAQHPFALFIAFDTRGKLAAPLQLLADFVGDRLILARVGAGANDKIVGETGYARKVQNFDVGGLFFLGGSNGDAPSGFDFLSRIRLSIRLCISLCTSTL
jgi:hypothetical protein